MFANALAGVTAGAVIFGVTVALGGFGVSAASNTGVVMGVAALGSVHWVVLRRCVPQAHLLALGSIGGLLGAAVGGGMLGALGGQFSAGAGFGAGYGVVTGAVTAFVRSRAEAPSSR